MILLVILTYIHGKSRLIYFLANWYMQNNVSINTVSIIKEIHVECYFPLSLSLSLPLSSLFNKCLFIAVACNIGFRGNGRQRFIWIYSFNTRWLFLLLPPILHQIALCMCVIHVYTHCVKMYSFIMNINAGE